MLTSALLALIAALASDALQEKQAELVHRQLELDVDALTSAELAEYLRGLGLHVTGNKANRRQRLMTALTTRAALRDVDLSELRVVDLRQILRQLPGLHVSGNKADLIRRLEQFAHRQLRAMPPKNQPTFFISYIHPLTGRRLLWTHGMSRRGAERHTHQISQQLQRMHWAAEHLGLPTAAGPSVRVERQYPGSLPPQPDAEERQMLDHLHTRVATDAMFQTSRQRRDYEQAARTLKALTGDGY